MSQTSLNICENPECSKLIKNITAKIALGFQIRGEECVKPTSALYTQIPLTRTTIAFLERTTLKEEERQMPTDLSCCCSSCGCSRNCRQHPRLFLPLPHFSSSCMTWLLPFPFFSIVESVMALFPSTLASWVAKWGFFFFCLTYSWCFKTCLSLLYKLTSYDLVYN